MDLRQTAYPYNHSQYHMAVALFSRHGHVYLSHSGKMMYSCVSFPSASTRIRVKAQARHVQRDLGDDLAAILSDLTGKGLLDYETGKLEEENRQRDALEAAAENYADILLDLEVSEHGDN